MDNNNITVLVVDDHQLFIDGLKAILKYVDGISVIGEALSGMDALKFLENKQPQVIITDISMPGMKGDELSRKVIELYPHIFILALSMHNDIAIIDKMIAAGVKGYILKNTGREELTEAIKTVSKGENFYSTEVKEEMLKKYVSKSTVFIQNENRTFNGVAYLTRREKELIAFLMEGLTNSEIAIRMKLSVNTVKSHRKNIYSKTNVNNTISLLDYIKSNQIKL